MNDQVSPQQAPTRFGADEAHEIADNLRSRSGVVLAYYQQDGDFFVTYPLSRTLAMIESFVHGYGLDELQGSSLPPEDVTEAETLLERCLDALRASSQPFSFMIHIRGWDAPRLYADDGERCGIPDLLDLLASEMQMTLER